MSAPRLLDLFCGAGGAAMGYRRAGFQVVGVDKEPQPRYPFDFHQDDAQAFLDDLVEEDDRRGFVAIHASPPCQFASSLRSLHPTVKHENLIPSTRELLIATGLPYVIENVEGARRHLREPVMICGSMFDPPMDVRRHRYFEANWPLEPPMWPCRHKLWDFRYRSLDQRRGRGSRVVQVHGEGIQTRSYTASRTIGVHGGANYAGEGDLRSRAMGIDWMLQRELTQAIPPAYTELIGGQLVAYLARSPVGGAAPGGEPG